MVSKFDRIGKVVGHVKYVGRNKAGKVIYRHEHNVDLGEHNTVCDLYYDLITGRMAGSTPTLITHGHCGTGDAQVATDTNLETPIQEPRQVIDSKSQGGGGNEHILTVVFTEAAGDCTGDLTECGLFTTVNWNSGTMMLYDNTLAFDKGDDDTLEITWTITHENC